MTSPVDAADRFVDLACLTYLDTESHARRDEAEALLAASPQLVRATVHAAAAAADLEALRDHLDHDPSSIGRCGTARDWVPLLALTYSRVRQHDALACLDLMLARGADPNAFTMIFDNRFTALTGVMGEGEAGPIEQPPHPFARPLAERLLDAGTSANESQGLYNTHFLPSNAWLELLLARGLTSDLDFMLGQAVVQGFEDRVALLLAHRVSPNGHNHYDKRAHLDNARLNGHVAIVRRLEAAGATPSTLTPPDAFRAACLCGDAETARALVTADPTVARHGATLAAAARNGRLDAVRLALDLGAPLDAVDHQGLTPLHHAARGGHLEVARELVNRGASLVIRDPMYGGNPLGHARHFALRWPTPERTAVLAYLESITPP